MIVILPLQAILLQGAREVLRQAGVEHLPLHHRPVGRSAARLAVTLPDLLELGAGGGGQLVARLVRLKGPPPVLQLLEHREEHVAEVELRPGEVQDGHAVLNLSSTVQGGEPLSTACCRFCS
jgi:hypothetical protein